MNLRRISVALMLLVGLLTTDVVYADIYTLDEGSGSVTLSNVPTNERYTVLLRSPAEKTAPATPDGKDRPYADIVADAALSAKVDTALLHAVIATESGYNPVAVSNKGASGLMQLMPQTARRYGVSNLFDPKDNIQGGAKYLGELMQLFHNDMRLALAAYNAGENAVARFGNKVPPYRETIGYVDKVMSRYTQNKAVLY